jgi:thiol:disulfide interchange protein
MKLPQRHAHPHATRHGRAPWQGLVLLLGLWLATSVLAQDGLLRSYDDPFAAPGQPQFLPVEEAYPLAVAVDDAHTARLVWQMPPGYYLYQHAFKVTQLHDGAETALAPAFPPALEREDEYFGRVQVYYASAELTVTGAEPLAGTTLRVVSQGCADAGLCYPPRTQLFAVDADGSVREQALPNGAAAPARRESATASLATLASMALFAFGGGLILNLMPCVFPILSLKVLGFASAAPHERSRHGLFYGAGVILSFTLVALLLIALRGTGQAIGWGFQLQSPGFVITLAYLFTVMGLSLSGVVHFGGGLMNVGSSLAERSGAAGSFFTGVLAVVVASPCTAPFMGTALGFALTQATPIALAIFVALGAGMAAPMVLLSHSEAARRRMPAPGPWMDTLKEALAFPLYATALWLFWVAGRQAGVDLMAAALLGALLLALALWLWRAGTARRLLATACAVAAISLAFWRPPHERCRQRTAGRQRRLLTDAAEGIAGGGPLRVRRCDGGLVHYLPGKRESRSAHGDGTGGVPQQRCGIHGGGLDRLRHGHRRLRRRARPQRHPPVRTLLRGQRQRAAPAPAAAAPVHGPRGIAGDHQESRQVALAGQNSR